MMGASMSGTLVIAATRISEAMEATKRARWVDLWAAVDQHASSIQAAESSVMSRSG